MAQTEWTHKGVKITLSERGHFIGRHSNGQHLSHPSLDAIKKRIDDLEVMNVEPFDAIEWQSSSKHPSGGEIIRLRVKGIGKSEDRYSKGAPVLVVVEFEIREHAGRLRK